jgi:hypothetical protein
MHAEEGQAERSGQPPRLQLCNSPMRQEAKRSDHAEPSGKRVPLNCNINQRAAKVRKSNYRETCRLQDKETLITAQGGLDPNKISGVGTNFWPTLGY